jgi:hypothetical protein
MSFPIYLPMLFWPSNIAEKQEKVHCERAAAPPLLLSTICLIPSRIKWATANFCFVKNSPRSFESPAKYPDFLHKTQPPLAAPSVERRPILHFAVG